MTTDKNSPFSALINHPAARALAPAPSTSENPNPAPTLTNPLTPIGRPVPAPVPAPVEVVENSEDETAAAGDYAADFGSSDPGEFADEEDGVLASLLENFGQAANNAQVDETGIPVSASSMIKELRTAYALPDSITDKQIFDMANDVRDMSADDAAELWAMLRDDPDADKSELEISDNAAPTTVQSAGGARIEFSDNVGSMLTETINDVMMRELAGTQIEDILSPDTEYEVGEKTAPLAAFDGLPQFPLAPRTDPHEPIGHSDEFANSTSLALMIDQLRVMNDEKIRTTLMNVLPLIFGAKSITAENEIAIYIAENAQFRDWCMAIYKLTDTEIQPLSRSAVELDNGKMFLSRAPKMVDMHQAMIHAITKLDNWKSIVAKQQEATSIQNTMQEKMREVQARLGEAERGKATAEALASRLSREAQRINPLEIFRVQWKVTGRNSQTGKEVQRTAYLALRDEDTAVPRADGVLPGKHYMVTYDENQAHQFLSMETAFRTVDFIKTQASRIMQQGGQFGAFNPKFVVTMAVVQWAQIVHTARPVGQKNA